MKRIYWFTFKVEGTNMKEVNLAFVYQLGVQVHALSELKAKNILDMCFETNSVIPNIRKLLDEYPDLTVCHSRGERLLNILDEVGKTLENIFKDKNFDYSFEALHSKTIEYAKEFETVLLADLERLIVYQPEQKGIIDTRLLISHPENDLANDTLKKLSDKTVAEIRESGKCLAFDNYTASGFHILRALEIVLYDYYVAICKPSNPNDMLSENWGVYLNPLYELTKNENNTLDKDDKLHVKKVYALLQQIKNQDRNLIMHPETVLDNNDALTLFGIAKNTITIMSEKLP
jgi:hypothetical protein